MTVVSTDRLIRPHGGELVQRFVGVAPKAKFKEALDQVTAG